MKAEYMAFKRLQINPDFKMLQDLWIHHLTKIEEARDKAASRGQESGWRYHAGMEKGAKKIMMALDLAITHMEAEDDDLQGEDRIEKLLKEARGEKI